MVIGGKMFIIIFVCAFDFLFMFKFIVYVNWSFNLVLITTQW
jgi:hypothetical protein